MDSKTKLFLFSKGELLLIFLFVIVLFSASFLLGINIGKRYSEQLCTITGQDRERVELLSEDEELVKELSKQKKVSDEKLLDNSYKRLEDEFLALQNEEKREEKSAGREAKVDVKKEQNRNFSSVGKVPPPLKDPMTPPPVEKAKDRFAGKYTIQLGSHASLADAERFADAFRVRGYDVIINQVTLKDKGVWFRVSIGAFDTITAAREYLKKEDSLFKNSDYVIGRF